MVAQCVRFKHELRLRPATKISRTDSQPLQGLAETEQQRALLADGVEALRPASHLARDREASQEDLRSVPALYGKPVTTAFAGLYH
jgi:hypothetical protein